MPRIPLLGGAYQARSIIANAQKCINLYPEVNPKDALVQVTHYQRPGLRPLASPATAGFGRGLYQASNGNGYAVAGSNVYSVGSDFSLELLGTMLTNNNIPVSFIDNGVTILLVDGSTNGYTIDMATNAFALLVDSTQTFTGANRVDYIDTFIVWNIPGTNQFGCTLSNEVQFDNLNIATKTDYPDPIKSIIVNRHQILLLGRLKTEIWYDAGLPTFPFAELPGAYFEHGTCATFSVASQDISVYFLSQDLQGQGLVMAISGYACTRISNHALEYQIRLMQNSVGIDDAVGFTYQQDGHVFYVLNFPRGNQTWVFDAATEQWHQQAFVDSNGNLNRARGNSFALLNNTNCTIDWENGTIYAIDPLVYSDTVLGVVYPLVYTRTFPHIGEGTVNFGQANFNQPVSANGRRIKYNQFLADIECGNGPLDANGEPPKVSLRWSDDRGRTFLQAQLQSMGFPGEYLTQPQWLGLGIARDRVFELSYTFNGEAALNGAWVDAQVATS